DITADTPVGQNWLVTEGLKPGDKVVVEGLVNAREGAKAKVVPAGSKPQPENGAKASPATAGN
ncbi:MAG: hypothetical protein B7Y74_13340, partial [Novosphingobium sp. 35-62-5]